jgi:density-regulated protein DRP1
MSAIVDQADTSMEKAEDVPTSSLIDASKPTVVLYCGICTMPVEYCEFGATADQCRGWLLENYPDEVAKVTHEVGKLAVSGDSAATAVEGVSVELLIFDEFVIIFLSQEEGEEKKKKSKGGGAAPLRKSSAVETKIVILREQRQKRKYNTIVRGLETIPDVKIKDIAKLFGRKFSSGASVQETPPHGKEVSIQGDVFFDIPNVLISEYKIPPQSIFFLEDDKSLRPYA